MTWYDIHQNIKYFQPRKIVELVVFKLIFVSGSLILYQTQIIKTNLIINGSINHISYHYKHSFLPMLIKYHQLNNSYIYFHWHIFDTLYYYWMKLLFKHFYYLLSMGPIFFHSWMVHIANMKLMDYFLLGCIPYLFF